MKYKILDAQGQSTGQYFYNNNWYKPSTCKYLCINGSIDEISESKRLNVRGISSTLAGGCILKQSAEQEGLQVTLLHYDPIH